MDCFIISAILITIVISFFVSENDKGVRAGAECKRLIRELNEVRSELELQQALVNKCYDKWVAK